jgi:hypothetical protein
LARREALEAVTSQFYPWDAPVRQAQLLREHPEWKVTRGAHRDLGWYTAVAEACPRYLGFELPRAIWPTGPRTKAGTLTEVEMTHWPESLRMLSLQDDPRLPKPAKITATASN